MRGCQPWPMRYSEPYKRPKMRNNESIRLTIVWHTRNQEMIRRIRQRFGIPARMTVNRETQADIRPADFSLLEECARRGFIELRRKPPG